MLTATYLPRNTLATEYLYEASQDYHLFQYLWLDFIPDGWGLACHLLSGLGGGLSTLSFLWTDMMPPTSRYSIVAG